MYNSEDTKNQETLRELETVTKFLFRNVKLVNNIEITAITAESSNIPYRPT